MTLEELQAAADKIVSTRYFAKSSKAQLIANLMDNVYESEAKAIDERVLERVISLFDEAYSAEGLLEWLNKNDFDPLAGIDDAEFEYREDYEDQEGEWQKIIDEGDYLFVGEDDDYIIRSW